MGGSHFTEAGAPVARPQPAGTPCNHRYPHPETRNTNTTHHQNRPARTRPNRPHPHRQPPPWNGEREAACTFCKVCVQSCVGGWCVWVCGIFFGFRNWSGVLRGLVSVGVGFGVGLPGCDYRTCSWLCRGVGVLVGRFGVVPCRPYVPICAAGARDSVRCPRRTAPPHLSGGRCCSR